MGTTVNRQLLTGATYVFALAAIFSCSDNSVTGTDGINTDDLSADAARIATVGVTLVSPSIAVGDTTRAIATLRDYQNRIIDRTVTWTSSNISVASVDASGLVTGLAEGSAVITGTRSGKSGSATLTVTGTGTVTTTSTNPGGINDLTVASTDSTSATLTFTQVDDGTGQPAHYDVRYAVAPLSWGSANSVTSGTCATPLAGTAIATRMTCTVAGLTPATTYNFQLVAFRGTMNLNAVYGPLSNVAAGTTASSSTPPPPPPPPPPPGSGEPAGMSLITNEPFDALPSNHCTGYYTYSLVPDATAPYSPTSVFQILYPAGYHGGDSPGLTECPIASYRQVYMSMYLKFSPNFQGHLTHVNKIIHFWIGGTNKLFLLGDGAGSAPLLASVGLQGVASSPYGTSAQVQPNVVTGAQFVRGQWYHLEMLATSNSSGANDGSVDLWLNGTLVAHLTGIQWTTGAPTFTDAKLDPTWGGLNDTVSSDMTLRVDHLYLSGKN
jgi:hypothetical protein